MKNILVLLICVAAGYCADAQTLPYEKRVEFELMDRYRNEEVFEFGEAGIILKSYGSILVDGEYVWRYKYLNSDLELVDSVKWFIHKKYQLKSTHHDKDRIYTLFADSWGAAFELITVDVPSLKITRVTGVFPKGLIMSEMKVLGDRAYFTATLKRAPVLGIINWKTGEKKLVPLNVNGYKPKELSSGLQVIEKANEIMVYIRAWHKREAQEFFVKRYDASGEEKDMFKFSLPEEKEVSTLTASYIGNNHYIFVGTYFQGRSGYSEGIFFCELADGQVEYARLYNYLKLKEYFSYLSEKSQEKVEKKKARKEARGEEMKISQMIFPHEIIKVSDGYFLLCEAFYPTYRTETITTYTGGESATTTKVVFDGYQYTHAILVKFNKNGEMIWDRCFTMWLAQTPFKLKEFVAVVGDPEKSGVINMVFSDFGRVVSKSVDMNGEIVVQQESGKIGGESESDEVKSSVSTLSYWYGNYFITSGSQTIKNKEDENVKRKRRVFFIAKYKY